MMNCRGNRNFNRQMQQRGMNGNRQQNMNKKSEPIKPSVNLEKKIEITNCFRRIWMENAIWNRMFIVSAVSNSGDLQHVIKRLIKNPEDLCAYLEPFYGAEKTNRLKGILTDWTMLCVKFVNDMKSGNQREIIDTRNKITDTSSKVADLMNSINPNWNSEELGKLLLDYFKKVERQTSERIRGNYTTDIIICDEIEESSLKIADMMCDGVFSNL